MRTLAVLVAVSLCGCSGFVGGPPSPSVSSSEGEGSSSGGEGEGATSSSEGEGATSSSEGEGEGASASEGEGEGTTSSGEGEGATAGEGEGEGEGEGGATPALLTLDDALSQLRADPNGALLAFSKAYGIPVQLADGTTLFSTTGGLRELAGDFDGFTPEPMNDEGSFAWLAKTVGAAQQYKFSDGTNFAADELSRAYTWDNFGEMSLTSRRAEANIGGRERHFDVSGFGLQPRTVRVLFPTGTATHVLYSHDGQNLFDRDDAPFGGWFIDDVLPDDVMVVGIDNTPDRFGEYTPVQDDIGTGSLVGGESAQYAELITSEVRPLIAKWYGEPAIVGTMGSSLGGLVSFDFAERNPDIAFAASLSGTFGWGSIGSAVHNETMIQRFENHAHTGVTLYLDSGGTASGCADTDGDGIDDDVDAGDNSCETVQMRDVLRADGWQDNVDLFYVIQEGAIHNEQAWASRVGNVLAIFSSL